nr:PQQ-binding-like beta-propeller repeat protein [Paracidobacterium acidisoli]
MAGYFSFGRVSAAESHDHKTWTEYEGSLDSSQYSALKQIDKSNVTHLQQAWFYPAGNNGLLFGFNPVVVGNTMYVIGKNNAIVALDAATGKEIWVHDNDNPRFITHRGISYWQSKDGSDRRLFFGTGYLLHAIDASTGKAIDSFGDHGSVDLRVGLGRDPNSIHQIQSGTPGRVFENLIIMGSATGEEYGSPPGDLRAYDVRTGKLVWTFHTVPHPGEFGYGTWPKDAWKYIGGTNTWAGITIDEKRGIAYFPLGSPTYDFYGADRAGADLFSDCLLALDARAGKYLWHFQAVHHDLWDYDFASSPKLLTIRHNGKKVDVVAQAGKNGFLYVLDRVTGKPIWPIVERPVPPSDVPGEHASPTQPFPTAPPPFARQSFTPNDIDPYIADPAEREKIRKEVADARNLGLFTPPGLTNTIEMPGNGGGANWGASAADPAAGFVYIQSKNAPSMLKLEPKAPRRPLSGSPAIQGRILYLQNCRMCHMSELQGQPPSIPSLINIVPRIGVDRIRSAVTNGLSPMPAFTDLTPGDVDSLITYLTDPSSAQVPPGVLARLKSPPQSEGGAPVRYWTGYGYMDSTDGLPAVRPPWSTLTAYDLNKGTIAWQVPLGEVSRLAAKGITDTGSYWPRGGVAVTAGGLIFAGTKSDSMIRAYDKDTGKVLWEKEMPAAPEGIPAVYEVDGREYLVVCARPGAVLAGSDAGSRQNSEQAPGPDAGASANSSGKAEVQGYYVFALPSGDQSSSH